MSGRRAQAARNDERILIAARDVFVADPDAPISAVAERAGVGMSALYRRYSSKEELLQTLCLDGLRRYNAAAETALRDDGDAWESFAWFLGRIVEEDTHSLTLRLAGTFGPTDELGQESMRAQQLVGQLFKRTVAAGAVRADMVTDDLGFIFEMVATVRRRDETRTEQLRRRYLTLLMDALRPRPTSTVLPGPPPTFAELVERFQTGGQPV
ncbi:MAG TPA: TetR/AcrR family transcriptional regulator [Jiangellaceae bacterium]|nr:TetR/AcrR family transcriptional regulator [Jiangellaceae bacterium]